MHQVLTLICLLCTLTVVTDIMDIRVVDVELGAEIGAKRVVVDVFGDLAEWKVLSWVRNK